MKQVAKEAANNEVLGALDSVLQERRTASGDSSYVASLYEKGLNKILEKVGEEAAEVIIAAKDCKGAEGQDALLGEVADLWFHTMVLLAQQNLSSADVLVILEERFGLSGHIEKATRTRS
ncbi:phosphoribosyl-ATP diphosphatase [Congregibacter variabilis]|uniref:Phosphoribosyl-ATP pyrophosphatase n=1 Tax=Congregibacter variabilis TaxID=3081200 RepID=A0ABZ0HZE6_9GAMM|nr:phosphoribosyl-ATP diphosphatase [Congregibacter sp. IMCC43200]